MRFRRPIESSDRWRVSCPNTDEGRFMHLIAHRSNLRGSREARANLSLAPGQSVGESTLSIWCDEPRAPDRATSEENSRRADRHRGQHLRAAIAAAALAAMLVTATAPRALAARASVAQRLSIGHSGFVVDDAPSSSDAYVWTTARGFRERPWIWAWLTLYFPFTVTATNVNHSAVYLPFTGGWTTDFKLLGALPNPSGVPRHYRLHIEACDGDAFAVASGAARCVDRVYAGLTRQ
jgi:hypothetical protein